MNLFRRYNTRVTACVAVGIACLLASSAVAEAKALPEISGKLVSGSTLTVVTWSSQPTAYKWKSCTSTACSTGVVIGRRRRLVIRPSMTGLRLRALAKINGKWLSSRTSVPVRAGITVATTIAPPAAPIVVPAPIPVPAPVVVPPAIGSDRSVLAPKGSALSLGDGWYLSVVSYTPNATAAVMLENMFNSPPAAGFQFAIARIQATFTGAGSDTFDASFRMRSVGAANTSYSTFNDWCGVIPSEFPESTSVFTGGAISGNVCWAIRTTDASSLAMYDDPLFGDGLHWFALQ